MRKDNRLFKLRQSDEQLHEPIRRHLLAWLDKYSEYTMRIVLVVCLIMICIQVAMQNDAIRYFLTTVEPLEGKLLK